MDIDRHALDSENTGRQMRVVRFGRRGRPLIYVPSSGGDENEFESYGMPDVSKPWIDAGRAQVFAVDGSAPHTLWNEAIAPAERIRAYAAFERYAASELLPWVASLTLDKPILVGVSYGAFVAANLLLKQPRHVHQVCGLGGVYGLWHRLDGHHDDDVYSHTPLEYLPDLEDAELLDDIRATRGMALYAAEADEWLASTTRMVHALRGKDLPHSLSVWPSPADHHERWWKAQLHHFLSTAIGSADGASSPPAAFPAR